MEFCHEDNYLVLDPSASKYCVKAHFLSPSITATALAFVTGEATEGGMEAAAASDMSRSPSNQATHSPESPSFSGLHICPKLIVETSEITF